MKKDLLTLLWLVCLPLQLLAWSCCAAGLVLSALAWVAGLRWTAERIFEAGSFPVYWLEMLRERSHWA